MTYCKWNDSVLNDILQEITIHIAIRCIHVNYQANLFFCMKDKTKNYTASILLNIQNKLLEKTIKMSSLILALLS